MSICVSSCLRYPLFRLLVGYLVLTLALLFAAGCAPRVSMYCTLYVPRRYVYTPDDECLHPLLKPPNWYPIYSYTR